MVHGEWGMGHGSEAWGVGHCTWEYGMSGGWELDMGSGEFGMGNEE